jgi:very-short-patch-repair endonuclease
MREGQKTCFAKRLRREMTDAERALWHHLRNRGTGGRKFRRQCPVGPYIADFVCIEAGLVVEVDGGQHVGSQYDAARTSYFEAIGFRVIRFWNTDVLIDVHAVLSVIYDASNCIAGPDSDPSPVDGRGAKSEIP